MAIKNFNLKVLRGEKIGVIGSNGAGKSTLLRLISGIFKPSSGSVIINGDVFSIFSYSAGIDANLTGRENIFKLGYLRGLNKSIINKNMNLIENFCQLGEKFDEPIRTYSKGMRIRIGISMLHLYDPDILVFDEGLSAGDKIFSKKARNLIASKLQKKNSTLFMASHQTKDLKKFVNKGILIEKGKLMFFGSYDEALVKYNYLQENISI